MYFLSVKKSPTVVLDQIQTIWHKTDKGEQPEYTRRVAVQFQELGEPIPCEGLPGRKSLSGRSVAEGMLSVKEAANQSGLSEKEVVRRLVAHKNHGTHFVYVDEGGKLATYEPPDEDATFERMGGESRDCIVELDTPQNGMKFLCECCQQYFTTWRGVLAHTRVSKQHLAAYPDWKASYETQLSKAV